MFKTSNALSLRDRWLLIPLLLVLAVATVLRVLPLSHEAMSGDEMFSRRMATEPPAQAWKDIEQDLVHPPLYYLLLRASTEVVGAGQTGVRLLSVLSGLLTLPVLVWLGNRVPGARWCGLLAALCVGVGEADVFYSQEARSYALYSLLVLLLVLHQDGLKRIDTGWVYWVCDCLLMTLLVYTHYVGGLFVIFLVLAIFLTTLPWKTKLATLACAGGALVLFMPWLAREIPVYRSKHGLGENLDWQGHPSFYDLRQIWATSIGINNFKGATLLALALLLLLSGAVLVLLARSGQLRREPIVLCLICMGWLTPLTVYMLSVPPVNLPLFALRHVLPATMLLTLLASYGAEVLALRLKARQTEAFLAAAGCMLLFAAVPTLSVLRAGGARYPYDRIAALVLQEQKQGLPSFAVWPYGVGDPVDFYCHRACVESLPSSLKQLPSGLVLLYRPASAREASVYRQLLRLGYIDEQHVYFTDGTGTASGTNATILDHP